MKLKIPGLTGQHANGAWRWYSHNGTFAFRVRRFITYWRTHRGVNYFEGE